MSRRAQRGARMLQLLLSPTNYSVIFLLLFSSQEFGHLKMHLHVSIKHQAAEVAINQLDDIFFTPL